MCKEYLTRTAYILLVVDYDLVFLMLVLIKTIGASYLYAERQVLALHSFFLPYFRVIFALSTSIIVSDPYSLHYRVRNYLKKQL